MNSISRRLFLTSAVAGSTGLLAACGQEEITRIEPVPTPSTSSSVEENISGSHPRKWAHYGDSFTASGFLAEELQKLTGYTHISAGVSGDTSLAGAFRAGAVPLKASVRNNTIPANDRVEIINFSIQPTPIAANNWRYPCEISGVSGYMLREYGFAETYFYRYSPGDEDVLTEDIVDINLDPGKPTNTLTEGTRGKYSLIIGFGRNDVGTRMTVQDTVENIHKIISMNENPDSRYLIWDVAPWAYEDLESEGRRKVNEINHSLRENFGNNFVSPVQWILENPEEAFKSARVSMTDQDEKDIQKLIIPKSFRNDDMGHFNRVGAKAWAQYMFQDIKRRGW